MNILVAKLRTLFSKGGFARNVAVLASGAAMGQAVVILASPILTRLYTPDDFGGLAVYTSLLGILSVIVVLRYDLAIPLAEREDDAVSLVALALLIVVIMTLLSSVCLLLLKDNILLWVNAPTLKPYLWLLPIGLFVVGIYQVLNNWAIRKRAFSYIASAKFIQGVFWVATQIVAGLAISGPLGLLAGPAVGQSAGAGVLTRLACVDRKKVSWLGIVQVMRKYQRFSLILSFSAVLNAATTLLPPVMINVFYGSAVAGWFHLANQSIGLPLSLVRKSLAQVYFGEARTLKQGGTSHWRARFVKMGMAVFTIGIGPAIVVMVYSPSLFEWVFGKQWKIAGLYASLLVGMFLIDLVSYPLGQTLIMLERQDLQLAWDIARSAIVLGGVWIAGITGMQHIYTVALYSGLLTIMYVILIILSYITLRRREQ